MYVLFYSLYNPAKILRKTPFNAYNIHAIFHAAIYSILYSLFIKKNIMRILYFIILHILHTTIVIIK